MKVDSDAFVNIAAEIGLQDFSELLAWLRLRNVPHELITFYESFPFANCLTVGPLALWIGDSIVTENNESPQFVSAGLLLVGSNVYCGDRIAIDFRNDGATGFILVAPKSRKRYDHEQVARRFSHSAAQIDYFKQAKRHRR